MGDVLAVDVPRVAELAGASATAAARAGEHADEIRRALAGAWLGTDPAGLVAELAAELGTLGRFLEELVDRAVFADRLAPVVGSGWYDTMEAAWRATEEELWAGVGDDVGATAMQAGSFELAGSMMRIPRSQWMTAALRPDCAGYGSGRFYTGGGAVRGPDGREYPIVVPHLVDGDRHETVDADLAPGMTSVAGLGGADPGWVVVGHRTGVAQIHDDVGMVARVVTGLAVASGLDVPPSIGDDHLPGVRMRLGSRAWFGSSVGVTPGARTDPLESIPSIEPTVWLMVDGRAARYRISDLPDQNRAVRRAAASAGVDLNAPARANRAGDVLGLAIGALQGVDVALHLDDHNSRAYEVVFEENEDGRRRARIHSFRLEATAGGPILAAWHLFVDDDGHLVQSPMSYRQGPSIHAGDTLFAGNAHDPNFTNRLGSNALAIEQ